MKNYCIFEVYNDHGDLFEAFAANFVSRGAKHSFSMIETYCHHYTHELLPDQGQDYKICFHVFFNTTNPCFDANQLKVYRGKVSGWTSNQIARKDELLRLNP